MRKKGQDLIKSMLGESFMEDLAKFDMINIKTDTAISHEEISDAFKVVPRAVMSWLISTLSHMKNGEAKTVSLPFDRTDGSKLAVTKVASDVYNGEVYKDGKKLSHFMYRSIPGIGLVLLTSFELYDLDNLISSPHQPSTQVANSLPDFSETYTIVGRLIDEKLAMRDLIEKVVDKKMAQREAIQEMVLMRMAGELQREIKAKPPLRTKKETEKKKLKLENFLKKKEKRKSFGVSLNKSECVSCPDCGNEIFSEQGFSGCICFGDNRNSKIDLKKTESGVKISFSKEWEPENIEMLLKILQKRGDRHE